MIQNDNNNNHKILFMLFQPLYIYGKGSNIYLLAMLYLLPHIEVGMDVVPLLHLMKQNKECIDHCFVVFVVLCYINVKI